MSAVLSGFYSEHSNLTVVSLVLMKVKLLSTVVCLNRRINCPIDSKFAFFIISIGTAGDDSACNASGWQYLGHWIFASRFEDMS